MERLALALPGPEVMRGLEELIDQGDAMWVEAIPHPEVDDWILRYERWAAHATLFLRRAFTTTEPVEAFDAKASRPLAGNVSPARRVAMQSTSAPRRLKRATNVLKIYFEQTPHLPSSDSALPAPEIARPDTRTGVFVVHGRDERVRTQVENVILHQGLKPIVLEDQANRGRTLIEKFIDHASETGYAVIILIAEDRGAGPGEEVPEAPNRARQNVVLEFGYLIGLLGRERVAVLHRRGIERPSDIDGVAYISMDDGEWKRKLVVEFAAAGYTVDYERI